MSFSPKQFREALQESAKLAQKFQKFVDECKKQSIEFIYFMIEEFQKIIVEREALLLKVNAVFALQMLIQTGEYAVIQFVEAWLLPHLQEVALFHADKRTYAKTSTFFKEKGFPASTPNIEQLSHNYVTLVTQFVFFASAVKDSYYFYTDRLNFPSAFRQLASKLKAKGLEPRERNSQEQKQLEQLHQQYENNLFEFENTQQNYVDFFKQRVQRYLIEGGRIRESLDIRKILKNYDSWLCSEIIGFLHDSLEDNDFQVRRHALGLINEFFISGDIETIMLMNEGEAIEQIFDRIVEIKGSSDIGRGAQIYPEISGQLEQKKNFYIDYLRCLETWSKLCPTAIYLNSDQQSKTAKLYNELKEKQFIFPSNEILNKYKKEFDENMKRNQVRNDYIVQQLNDGDTSKNKSHSHKLSKYSHKISLIKEMRESTILTLSEIEKMIEESEYALKKLSIGERQLTKNMKTLNYFSQQFEKKFGLIEESVTESRLENIYQRGYKCLEKIQEVGPHYQDYQNGKIDYSKFTEVIARGFSQIDKSKSKSKASELLSKLSKSKDGLSKSGRSGLELSKSFSKRNQIHTSNGKEPIQKTDYILEKSMRGDRQSPAPRDSLQFTKTIVNMSNLQNGSRVSDLSRNTSKARGEPGKKEILEKNKEKEVSKDVSKVSDYSHSEKQSEKGPQTAKFILQDDNSHHSIGSFEKAKPSNIRQVDQQYEKSSVYTHKLEKSDNKVLQSGKSPSAKRKQQFSDSSWSEEEREKEKKSQLGKEKSKSRREEINPTSNMRSPNQTLQQNVTKSREEFSDSSFSQYNESNEQIREAIDKSQNPDFKMLFKQKNPQQNYSNNSRLSKRTVQSHEHYLAVLESLAPKSIHDQTDKQISHSRYSKDKSASQLPPKSNYDQNSKIDNNMNYNLKNAKSSISQSQISEKASNLKAVTKKENSSYHPTLKSNNTNLIHSKSNDFRKEKSKLSKEESKFKESSKDKPEVFNSFSQNHAESNSMYPPQMNDGSSTSKAKNDGKKIILQQSISITSKSPPGSKLSKDGESKISSSKLSLPIRTNQKKFKDPYGESDPNSKILEENVMDLNKITESKLQNQKEKKIREIRELQKRLAMLKGEEQKLNIVRSDWQSPTRPHNLRTALSPRFRNNQPIPTEAEYQNNEENFRRDNAQYFKAQHKTEEMNFDVVDLFKPPEGRLVYSRLYKKDLEQVNLKQRRKILKGKDLVFRNEEIEVGMMIHRDLKDLKIIYYITASKYIKTFLFKIEPTSKLSIHAIPGELSNLQPSKQYRIYLFAEVLQFPYKMPIIHFKYHPNLLSIQQNLFIQNEVNHFTSIIPFFFTKFLTMKPVTAEQMQEQWIGDIARGEETAYSKKLLPKHFYILQYYPDMLNLENKEYESVYAVQCQYGNTRFLLKLVIKINKFFYIQGILTAFRDKQNSEKIMEYCICCMNQLLSKPEKNILLQ